jgi:uncharacterized protein
MDLYRTDMNHARAKQECLIHLLRDAGSLLVAFSGGVDSSFLLAVAHQTLGAGAVAATAISEIFPAREKDVAVEFAQARGIDHIVFPSEEISLPHFLSNGPDRCYHCKRSLFQKLHKMARERKIKHVAHGANVDDLKDYRPGFRAANEIGVIAPLVDAGLNKQDIRLLSKEMGLRTWDKPTMACLASRIPYGSPITVDKLKMIDQAEAFLFDKGIKQCRVRHHGTVARIEVERRGLKMVMEDDLRKAIVHKFREIGFSHIAVDLEGYESGSMNRALETMGKGENTDGR